MISDVLSDSVRRINEYLESMPDTYGGDLGERIKVLVAQMDAMRAELDTPPTAEEITAHERKSRVRLVAEGMEEDD